MGIRNRLMDLLNERNMNANELATEIGVAPSTIYSIMQRDSNRIDIDLIVKISHALGVTADDLLKDEIRQFKETIPVHPNYKVHTELLATDYIYGQLMDAAAGCTDEQIQIAINMLHQFKNPMD